MLKVDHIAKSEVYIKMQSLTNMWRSLAYLYIYIIYISGWAKDLGPN